MQWYIAAILLGLAGYGIAYTIIARRYGLAAATRRAKAHDEGLVGLARAMGRLAPQTDRRRRSMAERISAAGLDMTTDMFRARRLATTAAAAAAGVVIALLLQADFARSLAFVAVMAVAGFAFEHWRLAMKAKARSKKIESQLPSALEMLSASVQAGLTVERALDLVSKRTDGVVAEEFAKTVHDITAYGYTTSESLKRMDARCGVPSMSLFASAAAQALERGSAVGTVLASQARIARTNYFQAIEEQANKMPVKMVVPLVLFILPGVMIVALAPSILSIMDTLGGM